MRSLTRLPCLFRAGGSGGRCGGGGVWQHGCGTRIVLAPRQARGQPHRSRTDGGTLAPRIPHPLPTPTIHRPPLPLPAPAPTPASIYLLQVGLGIHGEPGAAVAPLASADEVVDQLLATIMSQVRTPTPPAPAQTPPHPTTTTTHPHPPPPHTPHPASRHFFCARRRASASPPHPLSQEEGRGYLTLAPGARVALLVNNLGGSTQLELAIATRRAACLVEAGGGRRG